MAGTPAAQVPSAERARLEGPFAREVRPGPGERPRWFEAIDRQMWASAHPDEALRDYVDVIRRVHEAVAGGDPGDAAPMRETAAFIHCHFSAQVPPRPHLLSFFPSHRATESCRYRHRRNRVKCANGNGRSFHARILTLQTLKMDVSLTPSGFYSRQGAAARSGEEGAGAHQRSGRLARPLGGPCRQLFRAHLRPPVHQGRCRRVGRGGGARLKAIPGDSAMCRWHNSPRSPTPASQGQIQGKVELGR